MTDRDTRALMFDIGRVIVRVNVGRALLTLGLGHELAPERVWSAIEIDPRLRDFQQGRLTPHQWHAHLARRFGLKLSFGQFCVAWNSALEPETILGEDLFAQLAPRFRLVLLSNTDPIHVAHLEARFRFPRYFASRVYSCAVGASKPDPAIYRRAISETGAAPEQILYIDDAPDCVEAGHRAGMGALLFRGPELLLVELRERALLPQ